MASSPTKAATPVKASKVSINTSSPSTNRLRKLKSAHNLTTPSLISQQRQKQEQQEQSKRGASPSRKSDLGALNRSKSDAAIPKTSNRITFKNIASVEARRALGKTILPGESMSLERLMKEGPPNGNIQEGLELIRLKILDQGIKADADGMSSIRIYVWLTLLDCPILKTDDYLALIHRGASPAYSKIRNDTFRTLTTDPLFRRRVSEASLIRVLNAVAWKLHDANEERAVRKALEKTTISPGKINTSDGSGSPELRMVQTTRARSSTLTAEESETPKSEPSVYVQGMNVIAAPFLYAARSETEAFVAFHRIVTLECPGYIRGAMDGVHKGVELVDKVLAIVDPKLSFYLISKGMNAKVYAFSSVLTFCACTPPLPEVLKLWDFLFAMGAHNNIISIVAQLVIHRDKILESPSPTKILRAFPALQAQMITEVTLGLIQKIPDDVYAEIIAHAR